MLMKVVVQRIVKLSIQIYKGIMGQMIKKCYVGALIEIKPQKFGWEEFKTHLESFILKTKILSDIQKEEVKDDVLAQDWEDGYDMLIQTIYSFEQFIFPYQGLQSETTKNLLIPNSTGFCVFWDEEEETFLNLGNDTMSKLSQCKYNLQEDSIYKEIIEFLKCFIDVDIVAGVLFYDDEIA